MTHRTFEALTEDRKIVIDGFNGTDFSAMCYDIAFDDETDEMTFTNGHRAFFTKNEVKAFGLDTLEILHTYQEVE